MSTDMKHPAEEALTSVGVGLAGLVCLWAPDYLEWVGWAAVPWYVAGAVLGLVGLITGLGALAGGTAKQAWDDWMVAVFLLAVGAILFFLERGLALASWAHTMFKLAVIFSMFFAAYGFSSGLGKFLAHRPDPSERARRSRGTRWTVALSTLTAAATAAANLMAAFSKTQD